MAPVIHGALKEQGSPISRFVATLVKVMLLSTTLVVALAAAARAISLGPEQKAPKVVDQAYIVQLKADSSLSARSDSDNSAHLAFHKRAALSSINYAVRREFTSPKLFYGLSIDVQQNDTAATIKAKLNAIDGVEGVWPVTEYTRNAPEGKRRRCVPRSKTSTSMTATSTTTSVLSSSTTASSTNTLIPPKVTGTSDVSSSLTMSGVDKLHALGIKGKGMKIGVIDTGVDYRHPSLGGGFGSGYKIAGGYAYRDDDGNSVTLADPLTTCLEGGHGTHVSGMFVPFTVFFSD